MHKIGWILFFTFLSVIFIGCTPSADQSETIDIQQSEDFDGSEWIEPARAMPDFVLTNQYGEPTELDDLRGKPTLFFFGYMNCPDVCPLTLSHFKEIREALGEHGDDVNFMFISVDGERDTPEFIQQNFADRGIEGFIGLTGTEEEVRQVGADYGLYFELHKNNPSDTSYLVDHTSSSFLLNENGEWIVKYAFATEVDVIIEDLLELVG